MLVKAVTFRLEDKLSSQARFLLEDFRLAVNRAIRAGLQTRATSKYALCKLNDNWPGYPEEITPIDLPKWAWKEEVD